MVVRDVPISIPHVEYHRFFLPLLKSWDATFGAALGYRPSIIQVDPKRFPFDLIMVERRIGLSISVLS